MAKVKKLWFKSKTFGWGWYPASWQRWVITIGYIVIVFFFARTISDDSTAREVALSFFLPLIIVTFLFIRIAYRTGEKPTFRWGKKNK